ncbi:NRDE family protein [Corallococcus sp. EGB]|uniref:NRDE family protein n=1 Tax=Corallococcus sp. EGB TaxID=1521117 RepID=UPI001CBBBF49|nr:NRDE family protein [Corallococcus sp. EGB]
MCTVLILRNAHPEWPLVVAANRDEFYARPAHGPKVLCESPRVVGGQDVERGGTWMGVTHDGILVALTNQRGARVQGLAPRSRGEVVLRALQAGSVEAIERYLGTLPAPEFLPFNLLYGDARTVRVAYARPGHARLLHEDVPDGVHVLPNDTLDNRAIPKVRRALALAGEVAARPWPELVTGLKTALADHSLPPLEAATGPLAESDLPAEFLQQLQALCIHTEGYGTRSSAIVALAPGRVGHYLATDTAPCQGGWRDVTRLLTAG